MGLNFVTCEQSLGWEKKPRGLAGNYDTNEKND